MTHPMTKQESMVERCARAIYQSRNGARARPFSSQPRVYQEPYLSDARAAIAAMREPAGVMRTPSAATSLGAYDWTDEDPGACATCGQPWELVRPGKSQPTCDCYGCGGDVARETFT